VGADHEAIARDDPEQDVSILARVSADPRPRLVDGDPMPSVTTVADGEPAAPEPAFSFAEYARNLRETLARLKSASRWHEAVANAIPLGGDLGYLMPACELHATDTRLIETLTRWRGEHEDVFPTRFPVSTERTAAWLREQVLDVDDRILFLVHDRYGRVVGHMGLAHMLNDERTIKPDNIVRGVSGIPPSLMIAAFVTELRWGATTLRPSVFRAVVLRENRGTITLGERIGFVEVGTIPLRRHEEDDHVILRPVADDDVEPPDDEWIVLDLDPQKLTR
jgi:perosamine synthetase